MEETSLKPIAVALVAMSKALAACHPAYGRNLQRAFASAEQQGLSPSELAVLKLLVTSVEATQNDRSG